MNSSRLNPATFANRIAALEEIEDRIEKRLHNLEVLGTMLLGVAVRDVPAEALIGVNAGFDLALNSLEGDNDQFHPSFVLVDGQRVSQDGDDVFDLPDDYTAADLFAEAPLPPEWLVAAVQKFKDMAASECTCGECGDTEFNSW